MRKDWDGAAHLVGRMSVWLGLVLVLFGFARAATLYAQSHRGLETLATIDSTASSRMVSGGWIDLTWRDDAGAIKRASAVQVSSSLARKLRLGSALARTHLRIRYLPDDDRAAVLVVEDIPERMKSAAGLTIAGFVAISAGSLLVLSLMLSGHMPTTVPSADRRWSTQDMAQTEKGP